MHLWKTLLWNSNINYFQSILTFRSAIQGVIDDMVLEELQSLVLECVNTELQFSDVLERYDNLMPLEEYCNKMDDLYDEKHDHIAVIIQFQFILMSFCHMSIFTIDLPL